MPCKIVLFYNQAQSGFSETWYSSATDPRLVAESLTDAQARKLVSFRHPLTTLKAIRVTTTVAPKMSYLKRLNFSGSKRSGDMSSPDVVSTDAVVYFTGSQTGGKRMFIRGLYDGDVIRDQNGNDEPTAQLLNGFEAITEVAVSQEWAIRILSQPPTNGVVFNAVNAVVPYTPNPTYSVCETNGAVSGDIVLGGTVVFTGIPHDDLPGFPRTATVRAIIGGGTPGIVIQFRERSSENVYPQKLKFMRQVWGYASVNRRLSPTFERFSERKTGRPFGMLRGRARSLVRAL